MPVDRLSRALPMGLLWGWLPCGLVYSTLAWALTQGNAAHSALLMFFFGLGTLPAMIATGLLATRITALRQSRWFRSIMGIALILFGIWTIPMVQQLFTATDPRLIMLKKPRQQNGYNPVAVGGIGDIVREALRPWMAEAQRTWMYL